jgi:hypothetical protein
MYRVKTLFVPVCFVCLNFTSWVILCYGDVDLNYAFDRGTRSRSASGNTVYTYIPHRIDIVLVQVQSEKGINYCKKM